MINVYRNRNGTLAILHSGVLHMEDGRSFELAGREAAWTDVTDEEPELTPNLLVIAEKIVSAEEQSRALETARLAEVARKAKEADEKRAAAAAADRARYAAWRASPEGIADAARWDREISTLWGRVFDTTCPEVVRSL
jgi:hypothetical protein